MGKCEIIKIEFSQEIHGGMRKSGKFVISETSCSSGAYGLPVCKVPPRLLNYIGKTKEILHFQPPARIRESPGASKFLRYSAFSSKSRFLDERLGKL